MHRYQAYLHQKLDPLYPAAEIGSFSRLLLCKLAQMSSVQIYSDKDRNFNDDTLAKLTSAIDRLSNKEPIQYILGETEFYGLTFNVKPGVLIPRPETEELVSMIAVDFQHIERCINILDIGTGSGCIAVSLAKELPSAFVSAWDVSTDALLVAKENAKRNQVNVQFEKNDILTHTPSAQEKGTWDLIVSNPPYVTRSEASVMDANVLDYEPHLALFVENADPLLFYRTITDLAIDLLKPAGSIYFEINSHLGHETLELIQTYPFKEVILLQDLSGKDRFIRAKR